VVNLFILSLGFGIVTASILALGAVGFTLQFSVTNVLNLAYGDVMIASAFVAYALNTRGVNIWIALVVGGAFGAVASWFLNRAVFSPFIRRGTRLFGMVVVTLSTGLIIENALLALVGPNYFSYNLDAGGEVHVAGFALTVAQLAVVGLSVAVMLAVHILLKSTQLGRAMRATAADAALARACGINTARVIDAAWLLSGALCGIAGVVLVINTASFQAATGDGFLIVIIASAILGGIGQPYGAMLGGVIIGLATELSALVIDPAYKDLVAFVVLVFVLLLRPVGIMADVSARREVAG
jgi:branched-subunit amino acid ABC-type transport system permease component